jgi:2'-5' RNA ligase
MKQSVRTFVAVSISDAVRDRAAELIERLQAAPADVKWVEPANMHLTLKFLGEVPLNEIPRVCERVALGAAEIEPFELQLRGAGAFPNLRRPRTIWLGAGEGEQPMRRLARAVEARLTKLGFRKENRRFSAHLTLGRVRRSGPGLEELGRAVAEAADFSGGTMAVDEVRVYSSRLASAGPTYEILGRAKLGGG